MTCDALPPPCDKSTTYNRYGEPIDCGAPETHDVATLELVRTPHSPLLHKHVAGSTGHSPLTYQTMTWTPSATRADVVRMVARFVRLEYSLRSGAGRLVVDESRTARKKPGPIDLDSLSEVETLDAIRNALIRRAVYAKPEAPNILSTGTYGGEHIRIRRVLPLRDAASIVRPKSKMSGGGQHNDVREWHATVAQKIAEANAQVLVTLERIRQAQAVADNKLAAAQSRAKRHGKKRAHLAPLRPDDLTLEELQTQKAQRTAAVRSLSKTREYRQAHDKLLVICTKTAEIEAYLFGEI